MNKNKLFPIVVSLLMSFSSSSIHSSQNIPPQVNIRSLPDGSFQVQGRFSVSVPKKTAWKVLSGYNQIDHFVKQVTESRIVDYDEEKILLKQQFKTGFLFFKKDIHLLLKIKEVKEERIDFKDISQTDFKFYEGFWLMQEHSQGLQINYFLAADSLHNIPRFIIHHTSLSSVRRLLSSVQKEILRHQH